MKKPILQQTMIFDSPVSLPCRRLRLYLPPGGRWLGAQPQAGESHGVPPQSISHGSFLRIVTSLTRPVSLPCRRLRLYLPPGGRWLGAQPQDGGSRRGHNQFPILGWYLPRIIKFPLKSAQVIDTYEQVPPLCETIAAPPAGSLSHLR